MSHQALYQRRQADGLCPRCGKVPPLPGLKHCAGCRDRQRAWWRNLSPERKAEHTAKMAVYRRTRFDNAADLRMRRRRLKAEVIEHYGGHCACCGAAELVFLAIDHINGGGNKVRKTGEHLYRSLKANSYPLGFRVLCHNCNFAFSVSGECPHWLNAPQRRRPAATEPKRRRSH